MPKCTREKNERERERARERYVCEKKERKREREDAGLGFPPVYVSVSGKDERLFQVCDDRKGCCPSEVKM